MRKTDKEKPFRKFITSYSLETCVVITIITIVFERCNDPYITWEDVGIIIIVYISVKSIVSFTK